jgi:hypothetical protein
VCYNYAQSISPLKRHRLRSQRINAMLGNLRHPLIMYTFPCFAAR